MPTCYIFGFTGKSELGINYCMSYFSTWIGTATFYYTNMMFSRYSCIIEAMSSNN